MELIQEFNELVEKEKKLVAGHEKKKQELVEREALCTSKENDLNMRKSSLDAREAQLVPIENMIAFKKDAEGTLSTARSERESLEADKKKWATQVQSDKGQIEQDRLTAKREAENNEKNKSNFDSLVMTAVKEKLIQFGHPELASKI